MSAIEIKQIHNGYIVAHNYRFNPIAKSFNLEEIYCLNWGQVVTCLEGIKKEFDLK